MLKKIGCWFIRGRRQEKSVPIVTYISPNKGAELISAQRELAEDKEITSPSLRRVVTGDELRVANGKFGLLLPFLNMSCIRFQDCYCCQIPRMQGHGATSAYFLCLIHMFKFKMLLLHLMSLLHALSKLFCVKGFCGCKTLLTEWKILCKSKYWFLVSINLLEILSQAHLVLINTILQNCIHCFWW